MRQKLIDRKRIIAGFIKQYYQDYERFPSEKDIVICTGISAGTVHRTLVDMRENDEIIFDGRRSARTDDLDHIQPQKLIPVLGTVACGPGEAEEEQFTEYIRMPECMTGRGSFFALIAKGESMVDVGVHPKDYVIIRKQVNAEDGDIVVALLNGKNNLKQLKYQGNKPILHSRNKEWAADYPDIVLEGEEELQIQGVAVGVYHDLKGNI